MFAHRWPRSVARHEEGKDNPQSRWPAKSPAAKISRIWARRIDTRTGRSSYTGSSRPRAPSGRARIMPRLPPPPPPRPPPPSSFSPPRRPLRLASRRTRAERDRRRPARGGQAQPGIPASSNSYAPAPGAATFPSGPRFDHERLLSAMIRPNPHARGSSGSRRGFLARPRLDRSRNDSGRKRLWGAVEREATSFAPLEADRPRTIEAARARSNQPLDRGRHCRSPNSPTSPRVRPPPSPCGTDAVPPPAPPPGSSRLRPRKPPPARTVKCFGERPRLEEAGAHAGAVPQRSAAAPGPPALLEAASRVHVARPPPPSRSGASLHPAALHPQTDGHMVICGRAKGAARGPKPRQGSGPPPGRPWPSKMAGELAPPPGPRRRRDELSRGPGVR